MVVERSVRQREINRKIEIGDIRSDNADMSNVIQCEKHCHRKPLRFPIRGISI